MARHPLDKRNTRAWRALVAIVVEQEPVCYLRLAGCTYRSDTADHVIPVELRPDLSLARENVRGACRHCNLSRGSRPLSVLSSSVVTPALEFFD